MFERERFAVAIKPFDDEGWPNVYWCAKIEQVELPSWDTLQSMAAGSGAGSDGDVGAVSSGVIDGVTGFLVPPGQPLPLRAALRTLARSRSLRAEMGRAGRARAEERFDLANCTHRLRTVLEAAYG